MDTIKLLWILFFVGGAGFAGGTIGGFVGAVIGILLGYLALVAIANLNSWSSRQRPSCECGETGFRLVPDEIHGHVHECTVCGARYVMRKDRIWDRVTETGARVPSQRRGFLEKWRAVENKR